MSSYLWTVTRQHTTQIIIYLVPMWQSPGNTPTNKQIFSFPLSPALHLARIAWQHDYQATALVTKSVSHQYIYQASDDSLHLLVS